MNCIVALVFVAAISDALAGEDGKYRPEKYGNEGKYKPALDGRYFDYRNRYNYYGRNVYDAAYNPFSYNSLRPYQELVAPFVRSDIPHVVVTARPPIVPTAAVPLIPSAKYIPIHLDGRNARIINQDSDSSANGYHYKFQTENGIAAEETGNIATSASEGNKVRGFYEYIGDNGLTYRVDYTADENGFHPTGAHLP